MYLILALIFSFNVMSQTVDPRKDSTHVCKGDFILYCKDEVPSDKNYWGCLGRNMNVLSAKCSDFMKVVYEQQNECGKDILTFCNGAKKNYGKWVPCLNERRSSVSKKCEKMLSNLDKRLAVRKAISQTCTKEKAKVCGKLSTEVCVGTINKMPESELSPECKAKVTELKSLF